MTLLSIDDFLNMSLIENMIDPKLQIQPNSIELTLKTIESYESAGYIGFDNKDRKLPKTKILEFDKNDWIHLKKGIYKIKFNEIVKIPKNISAIARTRSSLLRCGVCIETGLWDAGYIGRSEGLLVVYNEYGFNIKRNARVLQLIFFKIEKEVSKAYSGSYQNENL